METNEENRMVELQVSPAELIASASSNTNENVERNHKISNIIATVSENKLARNAKVRFIG